MTTQPRRTTSASNDSTFTTWIASLALLIVGVLLAGGFWMQSQNRQDHQQRQQAATYRTYLNNTIPTPTLAEKPRTAANEARETRQYLLNHPAVSPGEHFDKPGVQSTGKAIVQAIDQAKGM